MPPPERTAATVGGKRKRQGLLSSPSPLKTLYHNVEDDGRRETESSLNSTVKNKAHRMDRRQVFANSAKALFAGIATPLLLDPTDPANALLLRFPVDEPNTQPLKNKYHFLRAGTSDLEMEGIYSTNPLFLTNRENALSPEGLDSLKEAAEMLKRTPLQPTVAYHSLAANGMDTGDYLAREMRLGRDRLLPEFTYLDQRGIGLWDSSDESVVRPAVWAMDAREAGAEGFGARPPANTDGTPNDTLHDQFTRLRQFLSLQESRTAGDIILVIFPDGTGPALLSCMIAGIPYQDVHTLEYKPGELRLDITRESILELYEKRKNDPVYLETIEDGAQKLKDLRSMKAKEFSVSFKDSQADQKQEEENRVLYEQQKAVAAEKLKAEEERRAVTQEQMRLSKEAAKKKEEERLSKELAIKEQKAQKLREAKDLAEKKKAEQQAAYVAKKQRLAEKQAAVAAGAVSKAGEDSSSSFGLSPTVLATTTLGAIGAAVTAAVVLENDQEEGKNDNCAAVIAENDGSDDDSAIAETATKSVEEKEETEASPVFSVATDKNLDPVPTDALPSEIKDESNETAVVVNTTQPIPMDDDEGKKDTEDAGATDEVSAAATTPKIDEDPEEEFARKLEAAEQDMKDAFAEAAEIKEKNQNEQKQSQPPKKANSSLFDNDPPVIVTKTVKKTSNFVYDDDEDDSNWLRVLGEIRDEVEEEDDDFGMVDYAAMMKDSGTEL